MLGDNCYAEDAEIIDPTLWSYVDFVDGIWYGDAGIGWYKPHGAGSLFDWKPVTAGGDPIYLEGLSKTAQIFMDMVYPSDLNGWHSLLAKAPVDGWPAREIYEAAYKNEDLRAFIPINLLKLFEVYPELVAATHAMMNGIMSEEEWNAIQREAAST